MRDSLSLSILAARMLDPSVPHVTLCLGRYLNNIIEKQELEAKRAEALREPPVLHTPTHEAMRTDEDTEHDESSERGDCASTLRTNMDDAYGSTTVRVRWWFV